MLTPAQLKERLERGKDTAIKALLEGLGIKSQAELKRMMDEAKAAKEAQMTEQERLTKRLAELEKERDQAKETARLTAVRSAIQVQAAQVGAVYPEDAISLVGDLNTFFDDAGQITGVEEAIKRLVETGRLPVKATKPIAPRLDAGAGTGQRATESRAAELSQDELEVSRKMGLTPESYLKSKVNKR